MLDSPPGVDRAVDDPWRADAIGPQRGVKGHGVPVAERGLQRVPADHPKKVSPSGPPSFTGQNGESDLLKKGIPIPIPPKIIPL